MEYTTAEELANEVLDMPTEDDIMVRLSGMTDWLHREVANEMIKALLSEVQELEEERAVLKDNLYMVGQTLDVLPR